MHTCQNVLQHSVNMCKDPQGMAMLNLLQAAITDEAPLPKATVPSHHLTMHEAVLEHSQHAVQHRACMQRSAQGFG